MFGEIEFSGRTTSKKPKNFDISNIEVIRT